MRPERATAELAARQHGVVATWQLDLTPSQIKTRVGRGSLHRLHQGVYAVGHPHVSRSGRLMAAVLAAGPGAAISHRSAADLHRIRQHRGRWIEVTAPGRRRKRAGMVIHESRTLAGHVTVVDGIPVTTVERTLTDLADVVVPTALKRALEQAERLHLIDRDDLIPQPGRRRVVHQAHSFTRSQAELLLNEQFKTWDVPSPELNQQLGPWEVDFLWRNAKVVLELDFYATHRGRSAYARDREKTAWLEERGFRVLRVDGETLDIPTVHRRLTQLLHQIG